MTRSEFVHSPLSASNKTDVTECVNRMRKCENLRQAPNFTPFLDPCLSLSTSPLEKIWLRQTKRPLIPDSKLLKSCDVCLRSKPYSAISHKEKSIVTSYKYNLDFSQTPKVNNLFEGK